jgi:hypothetical protein
MTGAGAVGDIEIKTLLRVVGGTSTPINDHNDHGYEHHDSQKGSPQPHD